MSGEYGSGVYGSGFYGSGEEEYMGLTGSLNAYPIALPSTPGPRHVYWGPRSAVASLESPFTLSEQIQAHMGQRWEVRLEYPSMDEFTAALWRGTLLKLNGRQGTFLLGDSIRQTPYGSAGGSPVVKGADQTGQTLMVAGFPVSTNNVLMGGIDWLQIGGPGYLPAWTGVPSWFTDLHIKSRNATEIVIAFSDSPSDDEVLDWSMGAVKGHQAVNSGAEQVTITHNFGAGSAHLHLVLHNVNTDAAGNAAIDIWPRHRESPIDGAPLILNDCKGTFRLKDNLMEFDINRARRYGFEIDCVEAF